MAFSKRNSTYNDRFSSMILSAGIGERFRPHTLTLPKPAIPFLNIPFLYYSIHLAEQLGTEKIIINTHHLPHIIKEVADATPNHTSDIIYTDEQPTILGSGGGIKNAQQYIEGNGSFLTLNADSAYLIKDFGFWEKMRKKMYDTGALAILALVEHPKVGSFYNGVWIDETNHIRGIAKTASGKNLKGLHFTGVQLLNDEIFPLIPKKPCDIFRDIILPALSEGQRVLGMEVPGLWYEGGSLIGYLEDTKSLLTSLQKETKNTIKNFNDNGYCESLFKRFWSDYEKRENILDGPLQLIHKNAKVDPTVKISGFAVVDSGTEIEKNCVIQDSVIAVDTRINGGTQVKSQLVLK